jgi:hypothetical protein
MLEIDELKESLIPVYNSLYTLFNEFKENSLIHYIVETIFKQLLKPLKQEDIEKSFKNVFLYRL